MCIYVYAYMYAICMRQRGNFTLKAAGTSTHCMHAAARALHSQGSAALSVFHALYACGSAGTSTLSPSRQRGTFSLSRTTCMRQCALHSSTLEAARRHLGMSVCRRRRSVGLQRVEFVWFAFESVVRVLWSCGPAGVVCAVMLSAMHTARPGTTYVCRYACRCVSRCHARGGAGGLALEAWRWRLGAGGLALEASCQWPVAMRRRALGAVPPVLVALGAAWLGVACGVVSAGFGCRGPKKRRRADTEDEDTRKRPAAGSATWRHVLVRLHTRFVRCALLEHKPPRWAT